MTTDPRIEIAAQAIWAVRSGHPKIPGMTWNELLEALDTNPGSWSEEYERVFRQAAAVIAALDAARAPR